MALDCRRSNLLAGFLAFVAPLPPEYTSPRPRKRSRKNFTGHVFYQSHQPPLLQVLKNPFTTFPAPFKSSLYRQINFVKRSSKRLSSSKAMCVAYVCEPTAPLVYNKTQKRDIKRRNNCGPPSLMTYILYNTQN